jgi:LmbE family N-acetylglucosaminyl deacetylase
VISLSLPSGPMRILCLGAHPDDIEIGCGGTLLALTTSGGAPRDIAGTVVVATGSGERHDEAIKAGARFLGGGVDVHVLGFRDGFLPGQWGDVKDSLEALASSVSPDVVFAPRLDDAHQDHRVMAELATTVWRDSLVFRYEIPKWDGDFGKVTHYVPIEADLAQRKLELLWESFPSQVNREWWDAETFLGLMRLRGIECRNRYAEAFLIDKATVSVA